MVIFVLRRHVLGRRREFYDVGRPRTSKNVLQRMSCAATEGARFTAGHDNGGTTADFFDGLTGRTVRNYR